MEDYRLIQTGQETQDILNGAAMQVDLTAENERAELAETTLQGNIDIEERDRKAADVTLQGNIDAEELRAKAAEKQNADDIDALEEKVPSGASSSNKLTTEEYVNDKVATDTATYRGSYNLVSDLGLTVDATEQQISAALAEVIATADKNDYAFVQIPTSDETPTEIAEIDRYKNNGSAWAYEYALNNSGFTSVQWAAINSGITSNDVTKLAGLPNNSQLTTLLNGKQNVLTFDDVPTQGSNNPVKSGGVYTAIDDEKGARLNADAALQQAIEAILLLIPSAASALNQLADKAFVNSSIATNTATFRGTYNLVSDLSLTISATHAQIEEALGNTISTADNNDYAFVQIPTSATKPTEIAQTDRYKFNGTAWAYEYTLNNSGYTAAQWAAINSGITAALVEDIVDIKALIPTEATSENQLADKAYVIAQILLATPAFKGQFTTLTQLQAVTGAKNGDIGIVRTKDNDGKGVFTFYQYKNDQWNEFYTLAYHPQNKPATTGIIGSYPFNGMGRVELPMNLVDGWPNDTWLYLPVNGIVYLLYSWNLQLYAVYNSGSQTGLGLSNNVVVEPVGYNISDISELVSDRYLSYTEVGGVFTITKPDTSTITSTEVNNTTIYNEDDPTHQGINTITQSMMQATNTIYVIRYDFILGEDITVPAKCILEFDGGSISGNGTLTFDNTLINAEKYKIFGENLSLSGEIKSSLKVEWFGAVGSIDGTAVTLTDSTIAIQRAINAAEQTKTRRVIFDKTVYKISNSLVIPTNHYYLGTELAEDNAYPDWLYTEVAKIIITAKVPAFVFNYCKFTTIENIFVEGAVSEYNDIANGDNLCGFYANIETYDGFGSNIFRNVCVKHCTYGIHVEILGFKGFYMNVFTNVGLAENVIGLCIKGTTVEGQNPWLNHNNFDNCVFSENQNVGVYINTNGDIETFVFSSCTFEANGQTTSVANFEEYGVSAINICAAGQVEINNCYFEGNTIIDETLLQRALTRQEGHIILKSATAILRNNVISSAHQIVSLADYGGVVTYYNHWFYNPSSPRAKKYFVTIWNILSWGAGPYISLIFEEGGTSLDAMYGFSDSFTPTSKTVSLCQSNIRVKSINNGNFDKIGPQYNNGSIIYINENGSPYNVGLTSTDAIDSIVSKAGQNVLKNLKDYTIVLTSNVTSRALGIDWGSANVIIKSDSSATKRTVSLSGSYNLAENILSGKFRFENITFDISLSDYYYFIRSSNRIEFVNCDFAFNTVNWNIIASTLIFKNCTFTNNSGSTNKPGIRANGVSPVYVTFENCTNENLLNTIVNKGATADRPTTLNASNTGFCYWDTDEGKPIYWNGTAWVGATGTPV